MKKTILVGILAVLTAASVYASGLSKTYKEWPRSPESYFMTNDEKAAWKNVKTDDEAEKFIADYKAKRGDDFFKSIAPRIAAADKYFTAGSVKGSQTLRGKVVIMFGPPSDISQSGGSNGAGATTPNANPTGGSMAGKAAGSGGDAFSSGVGGDPMSAPPPPIVEPTFSLIYDAQVAPKAIGKAFRVELKVISNSEQEASDPSDLDQKFEAVSQASIKKANG